MEEVYKGYYCKECGQPYTVCGGLHCEDIIKNSEYKGYYCKECGQPYTECGGNC